jgi:hypothetical protein
MEGTRIRTWIDWYRFACRELGYGREEAAVFANLRHVEDENREALRRNAA